MLNNPPCNQIDEIHTPFPSCGPRPNIPHRRSRLDGRTEPDGDPEQIEDPVGFGWPSLRGMKWKSEQLIEYTIPDTLICSRLVQMDLNPTRHHPGGENVSN